MMTIFEFRTMVATMDDETVKDVLQRARVMVRAQRVEACEGCGQIPLIPWRGNRKHCGNACKQKAWRARMKSKQQ
jgi:hypothetical protein